MKKIITAISSMTATFSQKKSWAIWFLVDLWRFKLWYFREILGGPNNQNQTLKTMFQGHLEDFVWWKSHGQFASICISFMVGGSITIKALRDLSTIMIVKGRSIVIEMVGVPFAIQREGNKNITKVWISIWYHQIEQGKNPSVSKRKCSNAYGFFSYLCLFTRGYSCKKKLPTRLNWTPHPWEKKHTHK